MPTALITGSSSGIGKAFAWELSQKGYRVILVARREDRLQHLKERIEEQGGTADIWTADLADERSLSHILRLLEENVVDVLVNNAGVGLYGSSEQLDPAEEQRMIRVNISALVALTRAVLPGMIKRKTGGVIHIASTSSFLPTPYMAGYGATKAFVLHYSEALAAELKGTGVTVTAVCPGSTRSEFAERTGILQNRPMKAEEVARQGILAFEQQRPVVITGAGNWMMTSLPRFLPRTWIARLVARLFRHRRREKPSDTSSADRQS
ncbi:SDR family NAD(P)-dependent oxidoreductase [Paludifilum halophilum]|uniref:SDR family NAD(P)-dependent oxidoreductase n=1 Tax=Paludifilum halophilum TaxID=1642702 RepID=UPI00146C9E4D|nr:SDR family oxidoreductase [Paludifilum halophilum]